MKSYALDVHYDHVKHTSYICYKIWILLLEMSPNSLH
jgi:hypothetical protein